MIDYLIEDAGRLFEAGFMLGVIRALGTLPTVPAALAAYREQRDSYPLAAVIDRFVKHVPSMADRDAGKVLGRYYLFKGQVSGYTFLREYIQSLAVRAGDGASRQQRARQALQVRYWQCSLLGDNRLEALPESKRHQQFAEWMGQLNLAPTALHLGDSETGGFLRADLLLWIQHGQSRQHDILVVDTSIATTGSRLLQPDLTLGRQLLRMLESDITYLAEKGAFTRLAIETGEEIGHLFTRRLTSYFTAFASTDKESSKLIQAASYAYSFQQFAQRTNLFTAGDQVTFHIVGYSGRAVNSMTLRPNQSGILEACKDCPEIYSDGKRAIERKRLLWMLPGSICMR